MSYERVVSTVIGGLIATATLGAHGLTDSAWSYALVGCGLFAIWMIVWERP